MAQPWLSKVYWKQPRRNGLPGAPSKAQTTFGNINGLVSSSTMVWFANQHHLNRACENQNHGIGLLSGKTAHGVPKCQTRFFKGQHRTTWDVGRDIGRLWPYSLFLRFEVKKIGSQVTKCAWSPTPVTQKWCVPFVVACDPIRARSIIFEGSLAEKLRFWVSQLHFWRKSRRKASF